MIDNIKSLYPQVKNKTEFIEMVAKEFGNKPSTVKIHWFREFWSVPEDYQERVVELLQNTIKSQNEVAA